MTTTIDTWAWMEYFNGSQAGQRVKQLVEGSEEICTPSLVLLEFKAKYLREKKPFEERVGFICKRTRIVPLSKEIALAAAEYKLKGLHASDAIIYATARAVNSTLLTGDKHFTGMEHVEML